MPKIILHVDMDYFFAACEEKVNPSLKSRPIVVGSDPKQGKGRGVVSTCNYISRRYGINSGMPISKAYSLNPNAVFLPVNLRLYNEISYRIMKIIKNYSNKFQQTGIDEAYLDVTEKANNLDEAKELALKIKKDIIGQEGLTCSIGVSVNKLIAKIASEFHKPDGLTVVEEYEIKKFLEPLPVRKLYGVGPKTEEKLKELSIETIGQLTSFNRETLINIFGVYGLYLSISANGVGDDFVAEEYGRLSIGREFTFEEDVEDFEIINQAIEEIAEEIFEELKEESYLYRTISIKIRLHDFRTFTRAKTLNYFRSDKSAIINVAAQLAKEFIGNKIRLIGVRVSNLQEFKYQKTINEYYV